MLFSNTKVIIQNFRPISMRDKDIVANFSPSFTIGKIRSYISLTKPRLLSTVIFSAVLGYILPLDSALSVSSLNYLIIEMTTNENE